MGLRLEPITSENWRSTLEVRPGPGQLEFVADFEPVALVILSKARVRPGDMDWHPFAITCDGTIVGVVAITHEPSRCRFFHLVIDRAWQGQGLGKASVLLITDYVRERWPDVETLSLTVNPRNDIARHIYEACGFVDTGEQFDGELVLRLAL